MIIDPEILIKEFLEALAERAEPSRVPVVRHEHQYAPHIPHALPVGSCAVYVFSLSESHGGTCAAGPHRVLKVGKAGPNSNARFQSQHYNPQSSGSNLAATLVNGRLLWKYFGISQLSDQAVAEWIKTNLDRDNFYLAAADVTFLSDLEKYLRARLGPALEGG